MWEGFLYIEDSQKVRIDLGVSLSLQEYPIQFPNKLEIELDISFIYNQLKIKGTMEESTGYNGFTPSDYAEELYMDAKVNAQRKQRLQRRLDNLSKEQQQNLKHQMKQRILTCPDISLQSESR